MLVVCLNLRSPGWARQCPAHARLWLPAEVWRAHQQKHSAATRASLFPGSGTLKLLLIRSSRTQIQFHSFITKSKPLSPFQAQSSGKRPSWHLCSALMRVTLPGACPGGNSCHEPSSTQVLLPFCSCFFQTFPQPHLPTTADARWQWPVLAGCPNYVSKLKSHQCPLPKYQFYLARSRPVF